MAAGPQAAGVAAQSQLPCKGKATPIRRLRKIDTYHLQAVRQWNVIWSGIRGDVDGDYILVRAERRIPGGPVISDKTLVCYQLCHEFAPVRIILPFTKWMPHSSFSMSLHRPARGSSPGLTGEVHGAQPMLG